MNINLINETMNCSTSEKNHLYVGLCGTKYIGSDRYAVVITEVFTPKMVRVAYLHNSDYNDGNIPTDEYGNQFIEDLSSYVRINRDRTKFDIEGKIYKLRKNGRWIEEGISLWSTGGVHFGEADEYRDPSF